MVALNGGKPEVLTLIDMLRAFVAFREEVISRRTKFLLRKVRDRAHVLVGLAIAVANIDEVIKLIRSAPDPQTAREQLMERRWPAADVESLILLIDDPRHRINEDGTYNLSEEQARAILELRLQRLTALGRDEIADELNTIGAEIKDYLDILSSRARIQTIVKDELAAVRDEFGTPRRTEIADGGADMEDEDLIQREDMVVTVTHAGYIKRVPLSLYRAQRRGGKGRSGMSTKEEDFVTRLFVANTHTPVLFFSSRGIVYKEKVWRLPIGNPQSRGKALINMLPLEAGERITTIMPLPEDEASWGELDVMFATTRGTVRRNKLSDFVQVNRNGKIAMKLEEEGDEILGVETCTDDDDVLLTASSGQCIRFRVSDVRVFQSRNSVGVRGISMADSDRAISMAILEPCRCRRRPSAPPISSASAAERRLRRRGEDEEIALTNEEVGEETDLSRRALRVPEGARAVRADRHRIRLRQALVVLRFPADRPRRQGHPRHRRVEGRRDRPAGRDLPGRQRRPDHAGVGWRAGDPRAGQRHPHRQPRHQGRDDLQHRGRREGRLGRADLRAAGRGRRRDRGGRSVADGPTGECGCRH